MKATARIISLLLVIVLFVSILPPLTTKTTAAGTELTLIPTAKKEAGRAEENMQPAPASEAETKYKPDDTVFVSIVLESESPLDAGYDITDPTDGNLQEYREKLRREQDRVQQEVEEAIGHKLDVRWNFSLLSNIISASVKYSELDKIQAAEGVVSVFIENEYFSENATACAHNNIFPWSTTAQTQNPEKPEYYGSGSRIAILDSGFDIDNQSFSEEALYFALRQNAASEGKTDEEYIDSLDLLTEDKIVELQGQLNATTNDPYRNDKIPFAFNYGLKSDEIATGPLHGTTTAGIAAANRYLAAGEGEYISAAETIGIQGGAPDAQLILMDVFRNGSAHEADYFAALEDAVILGCDAANMSLGSYALTGFSETYQEVINKLGESNMIITCSAGNRGMWYSTPNNEKMWYPYLYADDVNYSTLGRPSIYTNMLSVASADMPSKVAKTLDFNGEKVKYKGFTDGKNASETLEGNTYSYILLNSPGISPAGNDFALLGSDLLAGKVAVCKRGFSTIEEKANAAAEQGVIALVIMNNTDVELELNEKTASFSVPVCVIEQSDVQKILDVSEHHITSAGTVYYAGSVYINPNYNTTPTPADYLAVSDFSSYGAVGSLVLKPDLIAYGGNVYGIGSNEENEEKNGYVDGTSCSAPQIAGMAAVLAQKYKEDHLFETAGISQRSYINSVLMSTAKPSRDMFGNYWPVFRVGAGLADLSAALRADSYILMDGSSMLIPGENNDGLVKAELGDDPEKTGVYDFAFTIYPIADEKTFTLHTDLFTQAYCGDGGYGPLQDTGTEPLSATITYEVDGKTVKDSYIISGDANADGITNANDAQAVLDYVSGKDTTLVRDPDASDIDRDGKITSYDAALILKAEDSTIITVREPTEVKVHIELDKECLSEKEKHMTKGLFVEGYTFIEPAGEDRGEVAVHSVPIYGYYGSWTDPSMFDRTSSIAEAYGTGLEPYTGVYQTNDLILKDNTGNEYVFMGNPYAVEEEFPETKLAIRSTDIIARYSFTPIRSTRNVGFAAINEYGTVTYAYSKSQIAGSYYDKTWKNTEPYKFNLGKSVKSLGVKEGDSITLAFYAIPEYYGLRYAAQNEEAVTGTDLPQNIFKQYVQEGVFHDGASIRYTFTVDDTPPQIKSAAYESSEDALNVVISEKNDIAYLALKSLDGTNTYISTVPAFEEGLEKTVTLNLNGTALPDEFLIFVGDYAGNEATVQTTIPDRNPAKAENTRSTFMQNQREPQSEKNIIEQPYACVAEDGVATLYIEEDVHTNNGNYEIAYNNGILTYEGTEVAAQYSSVNEIDGTVKIAFADLSGIDKEQVIAKIVFRYDNEVDTELLVTVREQNQNVSLLEQVQIPVVDIPHTHNFQGPTWNWAEDFSAAEAVFWCECGENVVVQGHLAERETPALPHVAGERTITAAVEFGEGSDIEQYTDQKTVVLPALECPCKNILDIPEYEEDPELHRAIEWAYETKTTAGISETQFGGSKTVTRAQAVTFLRSANGNPEPKATECPFVDVRKTHWFYYAVLWAIENHITAGTSETQFSPFMTCTKAQILQFLYATMGKPKPMITNPYSDLKPSNWYYDAALWAYETGLEKGENGKFLAGTKCQRYTTVLYLYRYFNRKKDAVAIKTAETQDFVRSSESTAGRDTDPNLVLYPSLSVAPDLQFVFVYRTSVVKNYNSHYIEIQKQDEYNNVIGVSRYATVSTASKPVNTVTIPILPHELTARYTIQLIGIDMSGKEFAGPKVEESVLREITQQLLPTAKTKLQTRKICTALIQYGESAKAYFHYADENPFGSDFILRPVKLMIHYFNQSLKSEEATRNTIDGTDLSLRYDPSEGPGCEITVNNRENAEIQIKVKNKITGETKMVEILDNEQYKTKFDVTVEEYRTPFYIEVFEDNERTGTAIWSVAGCLEEAKEQNNIALEHLLTHTLIYGDSVVAAKAEGVFSGD